MDKPKDGIGWGWWVGGGFLAALLGYAIFKRKEIQAGVSDAASAAKEMIVNTFQTKDEFIRRIFDALTRNPKGLTVPIRTILTAQAIHEAGWGVATASRKGYNYWNLTAGPYWKGPIILGPDTEYDAAGNVKNITQHFRQYGGDDEAVLDFLRFIGPGTRYEKAWKALTDESLGMTVRLHDYLYALHDAGYYTQPPDQYLAATTQFMQTVISTLG